MFSNKTDLKHSTLDDLRKNIKDTHDTLNNMSARWNNNQFKQALNDIREFHEERLVTEIITETHDNLRKLNCEFDKLSEIGRLLTEKFQSEESKTNKEKISDLKKKVKSASERLQNEYKKWYFLWPDELGSVAKDAITRQ